MTDYFDSKLFVGDIGVCGAKPPVFDESKSISSTTLLPDEKTLRISASALASHISSLENRGLIKPYSPSTDMATQINNDKELFESLNKEYCYYEDKYRSALKAYFDAATSTDTSLNASARSKIQIAVTFNRRLNSLLEIMNYISQSRAKTVEANKGDINKKNKNINDRLSRLQSQYDLIMKNHSSIETQKALIDYSKEKNSAVSNQIGLYIALNVLAIGSILFVSRSL
jgi:hypothetical protein